MRFLLLVLLLGGIGGVHWYLHDRQVTHRPGVLARDEPRIVLGSDAPGWSDAHGFMYRPLGRFYWRVVVVARKNYSMDEFAHLSPTDLAIVWGPLSAPEAYSQLKWEQMGSPFAGRFVAPEIRRGTELAERSSAEIEAYLVANLTHLHTIPADRAIASTLAGIRPGQVVQFSGTLVDVKSPSGAHYTSSLALHDHDCEIAWIDELELID